MVNQNNIEKLFDCFDESATLLYKHDKTPYLDGIIITCENIMSNSVEDKYHEISSELSQLIGTIKNIDFQKEEIRKAFQYACLKGLKHAGISNQMITPDTIGIFINYLVDKLYTKRQITVLDPLVGTGNLITTVANNSDIIENVIGVDQEEMFYKLSSALFDLLDYKDQVYCQDTMTFSYPESDCIITDFSGIEQKKIYDIIKHHSINILSGGFLLGIFNDMDVETEILIKHSQDLNDIWKLFGLLKLPSNLFKSERKSIVIFQRHGENVINPKKILLAELADFNDKQATKVVIDQLNDWFRNAEFYKI